MKKWLQKLELVGEKVRLIPLERTHRADLLEAAADGQLWNLWFTSVPSEEKIDAYLDFSFSEMEAGRALPFVVIDNASDKIIGSTRYCNADDKNRRLEIGYTWYAKQAQRTGINTEAKYLLLTHAFEKLDCIAVEFRTHWYNTASRNAIARLGAKQDGVLRNHRIGENGVVRDTVVFSIIASEWKAVKQSLEFKMNAYDNA